MDFQVDALGPCRKRVVVTVPPKQVGEEYDRQYDEINEKVALRGFRKGHAPRKLLEKRFATHLAQEVKEKLVKDALERLIEKEKRIEPLRSPEIDIESLTVEPEHAFEFEFEVVTKPEFETPEYEGLEVRVPVITVTDEDVDAAIDHLRRRESVLQTVEDTVVEDGDVLVVDWKAMSGDSVEAQDDNAYYLFGRGVLAGFVAGGLDDQLRGKKPGATASTTVRVGPDDTRQELRDRDLQLNVELKEVKRYILPAIDDDFLKRHDFDDMEEMREEIGKRIQRAHRRDQDRLAEQKLIDSLLEGVEISLPEEFVHQELEKWARNKRVSQQIEGIDEDKTARQIDAERADAKTNVEKDMKRFFLLDRIANEEDVKVTDTDLLQAIKSIASTYDKTEEEVVKSFRDGDRMQELSAQIRHRKTEEIVRRHAKIVEEPAAEAGGADEKTKDTPSGNA